MSRLINMMVTPGKGFYELPITDDMTLADVVRSENLAGRQISVDGQEIAADDDLSRTLSDVGEVWATGGAKGA